MIYARGKSGEVKSNKKIQTQRNNINGRSLGTTARIKFVVIN